MRPITRDARAWMTWGTCVGLVAALAGCGSDTEVEPDVTEKITIEAGVAGAIRWVQYGPEDGVEDSGPLPDEIVIVHPAADSTMEAGSTLSQSN